MKAILVFNLHKFDMSCDDGHFWFAIYTN